MKNVFKQAFIASIPVLTGYLALGFGFGIILDAAGYGILLSFIMAATMYSGSMQYVGATLLATGAPFLSVAITTLLVQARHLFYGISLIDKYRNAGFRKFYLMFGLTDETYSLVCADHPGVAPENKQNYYFFITVLDHIYWISGCVLGATVGSLIDFNSEGIDFVLTALFLTIFLEQWKSTKNHFPAIISIIISVICLFVFGGEHFLIPTMAVIALTLGFYKEGEKDA